MTEELKPMPRDEYRERYIKRLVEYWKYPQWVAEESAYAGIDTIKESELIDPEDDADTEATYN